jgi:hypothetical protein
LQTGFFHQPEAVNLKSDCCNRNKDSAVRRVIRAGLAMRDAWHFAQEEVGLSAAISS